MKTPKIIAIIIGCVILVGGLVFFINKNNQSSEDEMVKQEIPSDDINNPGDSIDINGEDEETNDEETNSEETNNENKNEEEQNNSQGTNNGAKEIELTGEYQGFGDDHSIEILVNGEYIGLQITDEVGNALYGKELGENITVVYVNQSGANTIVKLK